MTRSVYFGQRPIKRIHPDIVGKRVVLPTTELVEQEIVSLLESLDLGFKIGNALYRNVQREVTRNRLRRLPQIALALLESVDDRRILVHGMPRYRSDPKDVGNAGTEKRPSKFAVPAIQLPRDLGQIVFGDDALRHLHSQRAI